MKLTSARFRDQMKSPLETAIYWVEYVARHKGAPHMHSASLNMSFISYHNIDVFVILGAALMVIILLTKRLMSMVFSLFKNSNSNAPVKQKKS